MDVSIYSGISHHNLVFSPRLLCQVHLAFGLCGVDWEAPSTHRLLNPPPSPSPLSHTQTRLTSCHIRQAASIIVALPCNNHSLSYTLSLPFSLHFSLTPSLSLPLSLSLSCTHSLFSCVGQIQGKYALDHLLSKNPFSQLISFKKCIPPPSLLHHPPRAFW